MPDNSLASLYPTDPNIPSLLATSPPVPDIRLFRMFMIFGIGYNLLPCALTDGVCDGGELRSCATAHFLTALRGDDIVSTLPCRCVAADKRPA